MDAESDVDQIIAHLSESGTTMIGNSYFFIRAQGNNASIYRTNVGYGRIYSSEVIDHHNCGISDDDIDTCTPYAISSVKSRDFTLFPNILRRNCEYYSINYPFFP